MSQFLKRKRENERVALAAIAEAAASNPQAELDLSLIDPNPHQPRLVFDPAAVQALADSISATRLIEPIVVRPGESGRYILIAGERRTRAFRLLERRTIPAVVVHGITEAEAALASLAENVGREDLCDFEQYHGFATMLQKGFAKTQDELCRQVGMSQATVSKLLAFGRLPDRVLGHLHLKPDLLNYRTAGALATRCKQGQAAKVEAAVDSLAKGELTTPNALLRSLNGEKTGPKAILKEFKSAVGAFKLVQRGHRVQVMMPAKLPAESRRKLAADISELIKEAAALHKV